MNIKINRIYGMFDFFLVEKISDRDNYRNEDVRKQCNE